MIFFARSLPISENINSSLLFVLNFWTSKVREQKLPFGYILVVETGKTYPGVDAPLFKIETGGQCTVPLPLIEKLLLQKSQKHLS